MKMRRKEGGRIPFAYAFAIVFVLMLLLAGIYGSILGTHNVNSVTKFYEEADQHLRNVHDMVREKAYHTVMEVIHNVTKKRDPNIYMIQYYVFQNFSAFINKTFPLVTQDYNITVGNFSIKVVMDYKKTRDFIKNFKLTWVDYTHMLDNRVEGYENHTQLPVYPYVVGFVNYTYHDKRTGYEIKRSMRFNRIIYSPLPLLKFAFDEFNTSTTNLGDFGRLVRYILTTITAYRILQGYAAGAYDGTEIPVTEVLTKQDVEKAVNLALLLESVRFFHAYDENMAANMGISGILDRYTREGIIDAADLYFLWNSMGYEFSIGKILGQSIYGYADRFVYELLLLFWGNLANEYFADPTLKEPFLNWTEIKNKGKDWIRNVLYVYLDKWRQWLQIPTTIIPRMDSADISIDFKILIIRPKPPYVIVKDATAEMTWYLEMDGVSDTIDLILDPNRKYFTLHTMGVGNNFPFFYAGTYDYNVVKQSFVEKHQNYAGGSDPYFSTLKYVMDALTRSMKRRSDTYDDTTNKGFVDYAAYDAAKAMGSTYADLSDGNPKNQNTILLNGTRDLIGGPMQTSVDTFSGMIYLEKEKWWMDGAYKKYKNASDDDAYLYYLTKDTVDLWYEAMKNLYDGGDPSPEDDAGPYDSDCDSYPPGYQESTWPYAYDGYPWYGSGDHNGSFNFHRDMNRDAYNDIKWMMRLMALKRGADLGGIGIPIYDSEDVWGEVKNQTEDARQNVIGKNGLISDLNTFFPYLYFNPISFDMQAFYDLRSFLDYVTDTGTYDANFCHFVRWRVGMRILGYAGAGLCNENGGGGGGGNGTGGNGTENLTPYAKGVDVSHWQGTINWAEVYNAGYQFAFIKASESTSYVDPEFATNVQNAHAAGLLVGAYHFARPGTNSPIAEADHFVSVIQPYLGIMDLPPALDLEVTGGLSWHELSVWAEQFLEEVQSKTGRTPVIYINVNYATNLDSSLTKWPLWIAPWTYNPNATPNTGKWSGWMFWQYSDSGNVPGIGSNVDLDFYHGSTKFSPSSAGVRLSYNAMLDNLTDWLHHSLDLMYKNIVLSANYSSIPVFPSMYRGKYNLWESTYDFDEYAKRTKNETLLVDFEPNYLQEGSNLHILIGFGNGHRFVDVQDQNFDMGNAPFHYQINVLISGNFNVSLRTPRTSIVYGGKHWYTWYNDTVKFNLNIQIPVYTAWFLESHWNRCTHDDNWAFHTDVPFNYTRGYFHMDVRDTKTRPFFISEPLNRVIYDYEKVGEVWNRYSTFYHFALANVKDEMAAWNYTYSRAILKATAKTNDALNDSSSMFTAVSQDLNDLFTRANGYTDRLPFFYFERNFIITRDKVNEDNGYQNYSTDIGGMVVNENYREGMFNVEATLRTSGFSINMNSVYDGISVSMGINTGRIRYYKASFYDMTHRSIKMLVERRQNVYRMDFGLVGDSSSVSSLTTYFPTRVNVTMNQEDLIRIFHHILKDIYVNESIGFRFGIYVDLHVTLEESYTYIFWYNGTPTPDEFIVWLNNEIRSMIYSLGISEFPQHAYDYLNDEKEYYSVNDLWLQTNYESSSIFGYRPYGDFRGYASGYMFNATFSTDVPAPYMGHGD